MRDSDVKNDVKNDVKHDDNDDAGRDDAGRDFDTKKGFKTINFYSFSLTLRQNKLERSCWPWQAF